jgi:uncharacterized protein
MLRVVLLLVASNVFMTFAWYGHLKYKQAAMWRVILASWCIAFFEYCLQVPANRWGHDRLSTAQLKIMQEAITLAVFSAFAVFYMRENLRWNTMVAYVLIVGAVGFAFYPQQSLPEPRVIVQDGARPKDVRSSASHVDNHAAVR